MRFPPPTPPDQAFQSKLTLGFEWKRLIGARRRTVELTITDSAGETLSQLMDNADSGNFSLRMDMRQIDEINKFVLSFECVRDSGGHGNHIRQGRGRIVR